MGNIENKLKVEDSEFVEPDAMLATTKIPDGTPSIVRKYSIFFIVLSDFWFNDFLLFLIYA